MADDKRGHEGSTRREYLKHGGMIIGGGLVAGCSGDSTQSSSTNTESNASPGTTTDGVTTSTTETGTNTSRNRSYSVRMSPMGEVEFDSVPRDVMAQSTNYIDISAALGHGAAVKSTPGPNVSSPSLTYFYSKLDTSTEWIEFEDIGEYGKEILYELDSDVHFVDPCYLATIDKWSTSDVEEVRKNIGPLFGNMYSRKRRSPPDACRDSYQYYTLWELTEKYAKVFQEHDRFERLNRIGESLLDHVRAKIPSQTDRPTVGMVYPRISENAFYVHKLNGPGYFRAHTRPLAANDAFSDITVDEYGGELVDYEAILEADPDIIVMNHGISGYYDVPETKRAIQDHSVGSKLTAVQNDRLFVSGNPRQGPVMFLFQLEMTAKQLYPEAFGEWPGYVDGKPYPAIPKGEQLFDRRRLSAVITNT